MPFFRLIILVLLLGCGAQNSGFATSPILDQLVVQPMSPVPESLEDVPLSDIQELAVRDDSLKTIRVRLFPLVNLPAYEPYPATENFDQIEILNPGGFVLKNIIGDEVGRGVRIVFHFKDLKIYLYASESATQASKTVPLKFSTIEPLTEDFTTVLANKGLGAKEMKVTFRGDFMVAESDYPVDTIRVPVKTIVGTREVIVYKARTVTTKSWVFINAVSLEEYLHSVVPSEVYHSWPQAALQAQAMAARTFATRHMLTARKLGRIWDVDPTTKFQSYRGTATERVTTTQAVNSVASKIITHNGNVIEASYSANSGGVTCSSKECWGTETPYLRAREDVAGIRSVTDGSGKWQGTLQPNVVLTSKNINPELYSSLSILRKGEVVGTVTSPNSRTWQLRVHLKDGKTLDLTTAESKKMISGYKSNIYTLPTGGNQVVVGYGYGHGVGMSQWGAYLLSKNFNKSATEIIKYYYKDAEVTDLMATTLP